jgi:flagellar protein FliT
MPRMLIDYYKAIEDGSQKMLAAAREQDWEQVVRFEGVCAVLIEQLRQRARDEQLLPEQRSEKALIMQRILHNDAEIRFLTEPRLVEIESRLMSSAQKLH